jgi:hypothetical protein
MELLQLPQSRPGVLLPLGSLKANPSVVLDTKQKTKCPIKEISQGVPASVLFV